MTSNIRNVEVLDYDTYDEILDAQNNNNNEEFGAIQNGGAAVEENDNSPFLDPPPAIQRRVTTRKSPRLHCFYAHIPICLLLDSGAESNLIGEATCVLMGLKYSKTTQGAQQVDMKTPLPILGEVSGVKISKGANVFTLDALVTKDDIGDIVAGEPFLELNDVAIRPARRQIIVRGREIIPYDAL